MKVMIPVVDNQDQKFTIANGFNASKYVCIYDKTTDEFTWHHNDEITPKGVNVISSLEKHALEAIITSEMKPMALNFFVENHIPVYKATDTDLLNIVHQFNNSGLSILNLDDAFSTGACSGNCSSCSTDHGAESCDSGGNCQA